MKFLGFRVSHFILLVIIIIVVIFGSFWEHTLRNPKRYLYQVKMYLIFYLNLTPDIFGTTPVPETWIFSSINVWGGYQQKKINVNVFSHGYTESALDKNKRQLHRLLIGWQSIVQSDRRDPKANLHVHGDRF